MTGNIKFDSDSDYVGALVSDQDHVIMMGSQGEGAIMGSVSAGHSQTQVDAVINANLNSKKASVQATRTTDGGSNVVIEAQDPDSANAVSVKVGAKAADVTGGTLSVYRDSNVDYVDVGANQLKFGDKGLIFGGGDGLRIISGDPSDGGSLFFNGTQKTAQFLTYKPQYQGEPTENNDLVNKEYVDGKASGDYLPLAGGTMHGNINMAEHDIVRVSQLAYNSFTGNGPRLDFRSNGVYMVYNGVDKFGMDGDSLHAGGLALKDLKNPTDAQDAATKAYVDSKAGVIDKPTSGSIVVDTPTGSVTVNVNITRTAPNKIFFAHGMLFIRIPNAIVPSSRTSFGTITTSGLYAPYVSAMGAIDTLWGGPSGGNIDLEASAPYTGTVFIVVCSEYSGTNNSIGPMIAG